MGVELTVRATRLRDLLEVRSMYRMQSEETRRQFRHWVIAGYGPGLGARSLLSYLGPVLCTNRAFRWVGRLRLRGISFIAFTAVVEGRVAGFAYALAANRNASSFGILVLDGYQGTGVGTRLTRAVVEAADANNLEVFLSVYDDNLRARKLYESFSFRYGGPAEGRADGGRSALKMVRKPRRGRRGGGSSEDISDGRGEGP
jgi:ribosomal protein S18 acetylase RimI-like enzyme